MNRLDLACKLSLSMKVSKEEADGYLLAFIDAIITGLGKEKRVIIQDFGSFHIKSYNQRIGQKPITREPILIQKRSKPVFQPGKKLREIVNYNIS